MLVSIVIDLIESTLLFNDLLSTSIAVLISSFCYSFISIIFSKTVVLNTTHAYRPVARLHGIFCHLRTLNVQREMCESIYACLSLVSS